MAKQDANPLDGLTNKLTASIMESIKRLPVARVPFGTVELSKKEQLDKYLEIRDDPTAFYKLFQEHNLRPTFEYIMEMEKLLAKSEEENDASTENTEGGEADILGVGDDNAADGI